MTRFLLSVLLAFGSVFLMGTSSAAVLSRASQATSNHLTDFVEAEQAPAQVAAGSPDQKESAVQEMAKKKKKKKKKKATSHAS